MADYTEPRFQMDSGMAMRLRQIELLAGLAPVSWASLRYLGKPGEIAKFQRLRGQIESNIKSLNRLMAQPETTKEQFSLARSMCLQLMAQRDRAISVIEAIKKSEVETE